MENHSFSHHHNTVSSCMMALSSSFLCCTPKNKWGSHSRDTFLKLVSALLLPAPNMKSKASNWPILIGQRSRPFFPALWSPYLTYRSSQKLGQPFRQFGCAPQVLNVKLHHLLDHFYRETTRFGPLSHPSLPSKQTWPDPGCRPWADGEGNMIGRAQSLRNQEATLSESRDDF